ncbi:OsmC family protein [Streptomyces sp. Z26]|uniref:OsmC family protein n=1 Tax=Streptomyces sp. Z26 TaxID=2500177 RepID=UPI000EF15FF6|nr:OsmC family protein [Streptomyces sp. Z26]RLL65901.1 OsmC family peroxiredoxin [Streptomyces sp. Z26]
MAADLPTGTARTAHSHELTVRWTDTPHGRARTHEVRAAGKPTLPASAAPALGGEADRWHPEELLVAALSESHMAWFLHLAAARGVVVTDYVDHPVGTLVADEDGPGGGRFAEVVLRPRITVADTAMADAAHALHAEVPARCPVARAVAFPVRREPVVGTERRRP